MKERNIALVIIFSILTFGIYGIYWVVSIQNGVKEKCGEGFGGVMTVILMIVTFGLYGIYWIYAMGERLHKCGASKDNGLLYLALTVVGLGIVTYCLMQDEINKIVKANSTNSANLL